MITGLRHSSQMNGADVNDRLTTSAMSYWLMYHCNTADACYGASSAERSHSSQLTAHRAVDAPGETEHFCPKIHTYTPINARSANPATQPTVTPLQGPLGSTTQWVSQKLVKKSFELPTREVRVEDWAPHGTRLLTVVNHLSHKVQRVKVHTVMSVGTSVVWHAGWCRMFDV